MISILDKYRKTWDDEALAVDCQYAVHLKNPALLGCMRRKQRRNDQQCCRRAERDPYGGMGT